MRKKICILEDDIDLLQLLEINCKLRGYDEVYTETDGLRGFNLIKKIQPSIIILDLGLPNLDGIEVCKLLRKIKKFQKVPILAFSGRNCSMETLISVGFNDFIPKPSGINVLVDAIMQWLA